MHIGVLRCVCVVWLINAVDGMHSNELYSNSHNKFSIKELLSRKFDYKISDDIDMDPCKSSELAIVLSIKFKIPWF